VEIAAKNKDIESLECNLLTTQEEARLLSEEITNLSAAFESAQTEYDAVADELDAVQDLFNKAREEAERSGKESAAVEFHQKISVQMDSLKKQLTERLEKAYSDNLDVQRKLDDTEISLSQALKSSQRTDSADGLEKEANILRTALQDSLREVKSLKERCFELEVLARTTANRTSQESVEMSQEIDEKILSSVFESEEMVDLKKQFNALIEENINLEQVVRQSELALTLAKGVEERNRDDLSKLEKELSSLKSSKLSLQEEVYVLTLELERSNEDHNAVLEEARSSLQAENEAKAKSLQYQIEGLTIENSSLQSRIRKLNSEEEMSRPKADEHQEIKSELERVSAEKEGLVQKLAAAELKLRTAQSMNSQPRTVENETTQSRSTVTRARVRSDLDGYLVERDDTMEIFEKINNLLSSVDFLERHHEVNLRRSHSNLTSVSQRAEEIRRKVAFLTYAFQREKKEHSDASLQLNEANQNVSERDAGLVEALEEQIHQLNERLEMTETHLRATQDKEACLRNETELNQKKYEQSQREASNFKEQVKRLQNVLQDTKKDQLLLKQQLDGVSGNLSTLVSEAEERGKAAAMQEVKVQSPGRESMLFYHGIAQENAELHSQLMETEAALAAARSMKADYENQLRELTSQSSSFESRCDSMNSELRSLHNPSDSNLSREEDRVAHVHSREETQSNNRFCVENEASSSLLSSQLHQLSAKSDSLAEQIKSAEAAVATVYDQQKVLQGDAAVRAEMTEALQNEISTAIDDSKERNQELSELAIRMENRVNVTEEFVQQLEEELSSAKDSGEISRTGVLFSRHEETASRLSILISQMSTKGSHRLEQSEYLHSEIVEAELHESEPDDEALNDDNIVSSPNPSECSHHENNDAVDEADDTIEKLIEESLGPDLPLPDDVIDVTDIESEDVIPVERLQTARSVSPFTLSLLTDNEKRKREDGISPLPEPAGETGETGANAQGQGQAIAVDLETRGDCDVEERE
ncbi:MAG: hypothetical protein SGILL_001999, partial [Bacillariaceae sp.]